HGCDHAGRAGSVVDGPVQVSDPLRQHLMRDMARCALPWPFGFSKVSHRSDEFVVRILCFGVLKFIQECGILGAAIRVKEVQLVRELVLCGLQNHASKWSDTNSSDKEHGGTRGVGMKRKRTEWSRDPQVTFQTQCSKYTFEGRIAHSGRQYKIR